MNNDFENESDLTKLLNVIESVKNPVENLDDFNKTIIEIDDIIKKNVKLRENTPQDFFKIFRQLLNEFTSCFEDHAIQIQLITKCLKNSAAAFKSGLDTNEKQICQDLIDFLQRRINLNDAIFDLNITFRTHGVFIAEDEKDMMHEIEICIHNIYLNAFQYIFNLIQGNKIAYDCFISEWTSICFKLLKRSNLSQDIFNLISMIIVYGCIEKAKKSLIDLNIFDINDYFNILENTFHLISVKYLNNDEYKIYDDEDLFEECLDDSIQIWPLKLSAHFFDHFYSKILENNDFQGVDCLKSIKNRLNLFKMLKFKLFLILNDKNDSKSTKREKIANFCSIKNLDFLMKSYDSAITNLLQKLDENFTDNLDPSLSNLELFYTINDHFNEVKLLIRCLSDILTVEDSESLSKPNPNLEFAQKHETMLANTCLLFQQIHINDSLNKFIRETNQKLAPSSLSNILEKSVTSMIQQSKKASNTNPYFNLKCEFVRLIGILVYNNKINQNLLASYKVLHLISNNLNIDFDNPFVREWSLVALKHILSCLDHK